jgi:AcrR family transcriptional regulator
MPAIETEATWTPNQQAARERIIAGAADLIAEHGLSACTIRAVADRSGLTKSTVHYYFDDSNELIDLSVNEIFQRMGRHARQGVVDATDGTDGLEFLVRLFMGRAHTPPDVTFRESMLWPAYTAHAWKRGAQAYILQGLEALRSVFELALARSGMEPGEAEERANSVHNYLLGAMVRNMIEPLNRNEVARAVSALSGLQLDPAHC